MREEYFVAADLATPADCWLDPFMEVMELDVLLDAVVGELVRFEVGFTTPVYSPKVPTELVEVKVVVWERVTVELMVVVGTFAAPRLAAGANMSEAGFEPKPPAAVTTARATRRPPTSPAPKRLPSMVMSSPPVGR
jgi:hypothetical protein